MCRNLDQHCILAANFKAAFLRALDHTKTFRLFSRPFNIKFDETRPRVLLNVDSHAGICVVDLVTVETHKYFGGYCTEISQELLVRGDIEETQFYVVCFVELSGTMRGSKAQLVDTFCVLADRTLMRPDHPPVHRFIKRAGLSLDDPIALYWIGALQKVAR